MSLNGQEVKEVKGVVILAQEDRFRIETEDGRSLLLILGRNSASIEDLESLVRLRRRVTVRYRGEPDAGAVALSVHPRP